MTDEIEVEVKAKNPLDSLPKSAMSLDACKRGYNERKYSDKNFFSTELKNMFDENGYSIYMSTYKFKEDFIGRPGFINNNFVRGLSQNLDDCRKYVFGTLCLTQTEDVIELFGFWILRGQNPIKEVFEDMIDDFEWKKMELDDANLKLLDDAFYNDVIMNKNVTHKNIVL